MDSCVLRLEPNCIGCWIQERGVVVGWRWTEDRVNIEDYLVKSMGLYSQLLLIIKQRRRVRIFNCMLPVLFLHLTKLDCLLELAFFSGLLFKG